MKDFPFVYPDEYDGKVHNFMGEKLKFTDGKIWNDKVEVIFRGGKLIKSKGPKKIVDALINYALLNVKSDSM
jgi:hypothetical protein